MKNSQLICHWPWFDLSMSSKVKCYQVNWKAIYDLLYVIHTNFDEYDELKYITNVHIGPFWPWKWHLEWFHTFYILGQDYFHNKEATRCNTFGQHFVTIISIIMWKIAKPDFYDLDNDLLNKSMKSISWQLINTIPKKLYARNKEKLSDRFWDN